MGSPVSKVCPETIITHLFNDRDNGFYQLLLQSPVKVEHGDSVAFRSKIRIGEVVTADIVYLTVRYQQPWNRPLITIGQSLIKPHASYNLCKLRLSQVRL